jgi:gamma-glutamylputrescine oxidase
MNQAPATYYRATLPVRTPFAPLVGRHSARTVVVGGGYAGLNTALGLAERGESGVMLLEAQEIAHGASGRNGGFAFGGFSLGEASLLRQLGAPRARKLYQGTVDAVELIRRRIRERSIDCEANENGVLWVNWFRDPEVLRERQRLLAEHYGVEWDWVARAELRQSILSERYHDALWEKQALHIHPLKYAVGLADAAAGQGVAVHEHSPATSLARVGKGWLVRTPQGEVEAERVVLARGGYLAGLRQAVDRGVMPISTYVMVTEPLGERLREFMRSDAAVYDTRFAFDYYRPLPDTRLLWGGRISVLDRSPQSLQRLLYRDMLKVFPGLDGVRIDYAWSGLMGYTRHEMPQVGELEPGLWTVQGFGGHGVAPTAFGGELIASALAEGDTRWRELSDYGWVSTFKPAGFAAAQLTYWWLELRDAWKDWRESRSS